MAYDTANPPQLLMCPIGGGGPSIWSYTSADAAATVDTAGYITNAGALGMRVRDIIFVTNTTSFVLTSHGVVTISSTSPGAANLSDGVTLFNANTD